MSCVAVRVVNLEESLVGSLAGFGAGAEGNPQFGKVRSKGFRYTGFFTACAAGIAVGVAAGAVCGTGMGTVKTGFPGAGIPAPAVPEFPLLRGPPGVFLPPLSVLEEVVQLVKGRIQIRVVIPPFPGRLPEDPFIFIVKITPEYIPKTVKNPHRFTIPFYVFTVNRFSQYSGTFTEAGTMVYYLIRRKL
jgi:hypothetical protein